MVQLPTSFSVQQRLSLKEYNHAVYSKLASYSPVKFHLETKLYTSNNLAYELRPRMSVHPLVNLVGIMCR